MNRDVMEAASNILSARAAQNEKEVKLMLERGNESELWHIGTATSGRYPKGSGARPYQHSGKGPSGKRYSGLEDDAKNMSNEELKDMIARKKLEEDYVKAFQTPPPPDEREETKQKLKEAVELKRLENQYDKLYDPDGTQELNKDIESINKYINNINQGLNQAYNQTGQQNSKKPIDYRKAKELEDIADKELQQRINRMNMEKQYLTLMQERNTKTSRAEIAKAKVHDFLGYAVPAASIVGSVAPIAIALYVQKHK